MAVFFQLLFMFCRGATVRLIFVLVCILSGAGNLWAQPAFTPSPAGGEAFELEVVGTRFLPRDQLSGYQGPATLLTYDPLSELQSRNLAEAQSDLIIRGGTFENSGLRLGAASIYDPQTGHYLLEAPVPVDMLSAPRILSGMDNARLSSNASVGAAAFGWAPVVESAGILRLGAGDFRTSSVEFYSAVEPRATLLGDLAADFDFAHTESQGSRPHGDHIFTRYSGRLQLSSERSQTDFFAGYQNKSFSWPDLYAPQVLHDLAGTSGIESDELGTLLLLLNERYRLGPESYIEISPYFRRNHDDYEFDRYNEGLFNPYRHTSTVYALNADGRLAKGRYVLDFSWQLAADTLDSTALQFGGFKSRSLYHAALLPGLKLECAGLEVLLQAGTGFFGTNRSSDHLSPLAGISVTADQGRLKTTVYSEISQTAQVPGYTALASNPAAGLFRGNKDLGTTISTNYEAGVRGESERLKGQAAVFHRSDENLVDWTFARDSAPFIARRAGNIDLETSGFESVVSLKGAAAAFTLGYTWLHKAGGFENPDEVSFYAFNYPKHRAVIRFEQRLMESLALLFDAEYRNQEPNLLRGSDDNYSFASLALRWSVPQIGGLSLTLAADNIGNENFEEVPGVPGPRRFVGAGAEYRF